MANSVQNYKSSDFLTAKAFYMMKDGTEMYVWDDGSVTLSQIDLKTGQEHSVTVPASPIMGSLLIVGAITDAMEVQEAVRL